MDRTSPERGSGPGVTDRRHVASAILWLLVAVAVGCEGGRRDISIEEKVPELGLRRFTTEEELKAFIVQAAYDSLTARMVMAQMGEAPDGDAVWAGTDSDSDADMDSDADADDGSGWEPADAPSVEGQTGTNVQEPGVDEADIVKTDGRYLYVLGKHELVIVDAMDEDRLEVLGRIWLDGVPLAAILHGHLVVVFTSPSPSSVPPEIRYQPAPAQGYQDQPEAGYCRVTMIDVASRRAPRVIRTVDYSANYVSSRLVGGSLRVVMTSPLTALQRALTTGLQDDEESLFALREEHIAAIEALPLEDILPRKTDALTLYVGLPEARETGAVSLTVDTMAPLTPAGIAVTTLATFDLDRPAHRLRDVSVIADPGLVYASTDHVYLTSSSWYASSALLSGVWAEEVSGIHRFDISDGADRAIYEASGGVDGTLIDQFCMGEHDGYLRVASTSGSGEDQTSRVDVLATKRNRLEIVGTTGDLGAGEQMFSARFLGDRGFLLTAAVAVPETDPDPDDWHDPLFTLDLSNPRDPTVVGLWEGPGYSTYMHPVGKDRLLAVGVEGAATVVSLYDLSAYSNPVLMERRTMPLGGDTAALEDHRAFTYSEERELLALPLSVDAAGQTGVALFHVDLGGIGAPVVMPLGGDEGSPVVRTLFIDDVLFGVSECRLTNAGVWDPTTPLDSTPLYTGNGCF